MITIAVAGKGGTGKTVFAALTIKYLVEVGRTPVLAIDGDPSSNLNLALGMALHETVGQIREETAVQVSSGTFQSGISKPDWFEYQVNQCVVEGEGVDLLAMGRPEGPGCYCAANSMLRNCIDRLGNDYECVVIDNEAGMEHISRQTTRHIDHLFIISDPSHRGMVAAEIIVQLVKDLGTRVEHSWLVLNNVVGELSDMLKQRVDALDAPLIGKLPRDPAVLECDMNGYPIVSLDTTSLVYPAVQQILRQALGG